jgi:hypothetical protein
MVVVVRVVRGGGVGKGGVDEDELVSPVRLARGEVVVGRAGVVPEVPVEALLAFRAPADPTPAAVAVVGVGVVLRGLV